MTPDPNQPPPRRKRPRKRVLAALAAVVVLSTPWTMTTTLVNWAGAWFLGSGVVRVEHAVLYPGGTLLLHGVSIQAPNSASVATVDRLQASFRWGELTAGRIRELNLQGTRIQVTHDTTTGTTNSADLLAVLTPPPSSPPAAKTLPTLQFDAVTIAGTITISPLPQWLVKAPTQFTYLLQADVQCTPTNGWNGHMHGLVQHPALTVHLDANGAVDATTTGSIAWSSNARLYDPKQIQLLLDGLPIARRLHIQQCDIAAANSGTLTLTASKLDTFTTQTKLALHQAAFTWEHNLNISCPMVMDIQVQKQARQIQATMAITAQTSAVTGRWGNYGLRQGTLGAQVILQDNYAPTQVRLEQCALQDVTLSTDTIPGIQHITLGQLDATGQWQPESSQLNLETKHTTLAGHLAALGNMDYQGHFDLLNGVLIWRDQLSRLQSVQWQIKQGQLLTSVDNTWLDTLGSTLRFPAQQRVELSLAELQQAGRWTTAGKVTLDSPTTFRWELKDTATVHPPTVYVGGAIFQTQGQMDLGVSKSLSAIATLLECDTINLRSTKGWELSGKKLRLDLPQCDWNNQGSLTTLVRTLTAEALSGNVTVTAPSLKKLVLPWEIDAFKLVNLAYTSKDMAQTGHFDQLAMQRWTLGDPGSLALIRGSDITLRTAEYQRKPELLTLSLAQLSYNHPELFAEAEALRPWLPKLPAEVRGLIDCAGDALQLNQLTLTQANSVLQKLQGRLDLSNFETGTDDVVSKLKYRMSGLSLNVLGWYDSDTSVNGWLFPEFNGQIANLTADKNSLSKVMLAGSYKAGLLLLPTVKLTTMGGAITGAIGYNFMTGVMPASELKITGLDLLQVTQNMQPDNFLLDGKFSGQINLARDLGKDFRGSVSIAADGPGLLEVKTLPELQTMLMNQFGSDLTKLIMQDLRHYPYVAGTVLLTSQPAGAEVTVDFTRKDFAASEKREVKVILDGRDMIVRDPINIKDLTIGINTSLEQLLASATGLKSWLDAIMKNVNASDDRSK
ncbi:MAG: hypothetical protein WCJ97_03360 [Phycisphaerae bacterium]